MSDVIFDTHKVCNMYSWLKWAAKRLFAIDWTQCGLRCLGRQCFITKGVSVHCPERLQIEGDSVQG